MSESAPIYAAFLGTWILIPDSCDYEQGEPPQSGTYQIADDAGRLELTMQWIDSAGDSHTAKFDGVPNGERVPFDGGELADALSISTPSARELNSSAYWQGEELMFAQRQLDDTGAAMRVTQLIRFHDGNSLANVSVYRKQVLN